MDFWQTILATGLGGALAVAGPLIQQLRAEKALRTKLRRQKHEELTAALLDFDHWLDELRQSRIVGIEPGPRPSPLPRAEAIAALYFPSLSRDLGQLFVLSKNYESWMLEVLQNHLAGQKGKLEGMQAAYEPYRKQWNQVMNSAGKVSRKKLGID